MSVRKVYMVIVNGDVVYSGSYASCLSVYDAFSNFFRINFELESTFDISIAFKPS